MKDCDAGRDTGLLGRMQERSHECKREKSGVRGLNAATTLPRMAGEELEDRESDDFASSQQVENGTGVHYHKRVLQM